MSEFQPFEMERMMSKFEQTVDFNLSESGVHPLRLRELLDFQPEAMAGLLESELNYPQVNGSVALRENIAALYPGATADHVLVTVGAIEANYIATRTLMSAGDEIVLMLPNYMQIPGIARNHGLKVKTFQLRQDRGWAPDLDQLADVVSDRTRLIAVCNPNNPTGRVLSETEMADIVAIADRVGAWILADEVYSGAERTTDQGTPSFFGRYPKVLAIGSMSKAYGLPGLRVGWVVGPPPTLEDLWARHEYVAISATMLSNQLAALALSSTIRPQILARTRSYIRDGYPVLERWMADNDGLFSLTPPQAAAIAFIHYRLDVGSTAFCDRLRQEQNVLVVPGDHFGMDKFIRVSFGLPYDYLIAGLDRIRNLLGEYRTH